MVGSILIAANARAQAARDFYRPEQLQDVMSSQAKEASRVAIGQCNSDFRSAAALARCLENLRVKGRAEFDAASQRMMNEMRALDAVDQGWTRKLRFCPRRRHSPVFARPIARGMKPRRAAASKVISSIAHAMVGADPLAPCGTGSIVIEVIV